MANKEWTAQDLKDFNAFVEERGGRIVKAESTFNGGYVFSLQIPEGVADDLVLTWGQDTLAEFEVIRKG